MSDWQMTEKPDRFQGEPEIDADMDDRLIEDLQEEVSKLQAEREALRLDLDHANSMWSSCAKNLREAREKNRELWGRLGARYGAGG